MCFFHFSFAFNTRRRLQLASATSVCVPVSRCQPANKLSIEYFQLGHSTSSQEKTIKRGWRGIHNIAAHVVSGILDEDQWSKTKMTVALKCTLCVYFSGSLALLAEEVSPGDCDFAKKYKVTQSIKYIMTTFCFNPFLEGLQIRKERRVRPLAQPLCAVCAKLSASVKEQLAKTRYSWKRFSDNVTCLRLDTATYRV